MIWETSIRGIRNKLWYLIGSDNIEFLIELTYYLAAGFSTYNVSISWDPLKPHDFVARSIILIIHINSTVNIVSKSCTNQGS